MYPQGPQKGVWQIQKKSGRPTVVLTFLLYVMFYIVNIWIAIACQKNNACVLF